MFTRLLPASSAFDYITGQDVGNLLTVKQKRVEIARQIRHETRREFSQHREFFRLVNRHPTKRVQDPVRSFEHAVFTRKPHLVIRRHIFRIRAIQLLRISRIGLQQRHDRSRVRAIPQSFSRIAGPQRVVQQSQQKLK